MQVSSKVNYPALDGIRAVAILLVFMDHFGGGSHGGPLLNLFNHVRVFGREGVSLFFVLSGFLITGILYDTQHNPRYFPVFYARRCLRIFPPFYLVIAVCLLLTPILHFNLQWGHISFLFYLGNFFANANPSLYEISSPTHPLWSINFGHFWSLFVEEQFYLIWPAVVLLVKDRIQLIRLSVIGAGLILLLRIAMVAYLSFPVAENYAFRMLPTRADDMLVGAALALLLRGPNAARWLNLSWLAFLAGMVMFAALGVWQGNFGIEDPYELTIGMDFISMASAGLIALAIQQRTLAFRLLSIRPLRVLGKYSYGFYIYHMLFVALEIHYFLWCQAHFHSMLLAGLIYAFSSFLVVLLVAAISYEFFERRFLALKSKFPYQESKS